MIINAMCFGGHKELLGFLSWNIFQNIPKKGAAQLSKFYLYRLVIYKNQPLIGLDEQKTNPSDVISDQPTDIARSSQHKLSRWAIINGMIRSSWEDYRVLGLVMFWYLHPIQFKSLQIRYLNLQFLKKKREVEIGH